VNGTAAAPAAAAAGRGSAGRTLLLSVIELVAPLGTVQT
jgi:hypothetical protein